MADQIPDEQLAAIIRDVADKHGLGWHDPMECADEDLRENAWYVEIARRAYAAGRASATNGAIEEFWIKAAPGFPASPVKFGSYEQAVDHMVYPEDSVMRRTVYVTPWVPADSPP